MHFWQESAILHFMTESAITADEAAAQTEHRITVCAQRLTDELGLDGFTMDELAAAADVSRRTLFNYFPGKIDAVLGSPPDLSAAVVDDLRGRRAARPPRRRPRRARPRRSSTPRCSTASEVERARRIVTTNPRLLMAAHERFEAAHRRVRRR